MGFNPIKAKDALVKHSNNITRAIDFLMNETVQLQTQTKRNVHHNQITTAVQFLNLSAQKNFIIKDNGGAGDCLFLSLHETLTRMKHPLVSNKKAHDIRLEIVKFVMQNLKEPQTRLTLQTFEDALQHGVHVNGGKVLYLHNYENEMQKPTTYGTELEIAAAALLYEINIYVVNKNGISFDQLYIGNGVPTWRNMWYLFNINNAHYTSLICNDGPNKCP